MALEDAHPPIPEGLSVDITDFLRQCFKKDAMQRPDARTLLQHPWIQNSRRVLPSSLRQIGGSIRNIDEDVAVADNNSAENGLGGDRPLEEKSRRDSLATALESTSSDENLSAKNNIAHDASLESVDTLKDDLLSAKDPTLVFHQNPATALSSNDASAHLKSGNGPFQDVRNGMGDATAVKGDGDLDAEHDEESSSHDESSLFSFGAGMPKVAKQSVGSEFTS
ncbi:hypothetical protein HPP92_002067 [Vanilla planifolia]|uniref:non-specific serine/threonine protein kinase n=1 Tax=Vanilla planifolia TaxID=51239 RepID=A0A835RSA2_VANPL|nr:hypothetical protein HPP92_002067 [Vanilla planifolia]